AASPSPACGAGGWAGVTPWFDGVSARASLGAIRAFSTFVLPHKGQVTRPRLACLSYAVEFVNQLSNSCRLLHTSVYRIISDHSNDMKVCRLWGRFDDFEAPAMLEGRNAGTRSSDRRRVNLRNDDAGIDATFGEHAAPGVDDE